MSSKPLYTPPRANNTPAPLPSAPATAPAPEGGPVYAGPDLLLEGSQFWDKYKVPVLAGAVLLLLALIGSEVYQASHEKALAAASAQLDSAKTPGDYQAVIDLYPGTTAAANAAMLKGRAQMDAKDYAGAAKTWGTFADGFPQNALAVGALIGEGGALEATGKFDDARAAYQKAASSYGNSYAAPFARLDEANLLKGQRKLDDARRVYENLIASFPKSIAAQVAQEDLHTLRALPPPMAPAPVAVSTPAPAVGASSVPVTAASPAPAVTASPAPPTAAVAPALVAPVASVAPTPAPDAPK